MMRPDLRERLLAILDEIAEDEAARRVEAPRGGMRPDLRERLDFLADELAREEATGLVVVSTALAGEMEDWSRPVRIRLVEQDEPGLYQLQVKEIDG